MNFVSFLEFGLHGYGVSLSVGPKQGVLGC